LYPPEFRKELVGLARSGRSPESLAKEFEPSAQTIRNWIKQADLDEGRRADGLTTIEREPLPTLIWPSGSRFIIWRLDARMVRSGSTQIWRTKTSMWAASGWPG